MTKKLVEEAGQKCLLFPGDLKFHETREKLVAAHLKEFKDLDILVNKCVERAHELSRRAEAVADTFPPSAPRSRSSAPTSPTST